MSYPIRAIAGIGPAMAAKLKALGIRTTEKLLEAVKDREGPQDSRRKARRR